MVALSDFHPLVTPETPGAPTTAINKALLFALAEFCKKVEMWQVTHTAAAVLDAGNAYDLSATLPAGTTVANVMFCSWGGDELDTREDVEQFSDTPGAPAGFGMVGTAAIALDPPAQTAGDLKAVIALMPTPTCTLFDDALLNEWAEVIAHGAIGRLQAQPEKSWSAQTAPFHLNAFQNGVSAARRRTRNGGLDPRKSVRARSFY